MEKVILRKMKDYEYKNWMELSIKRQAEDRAFVNDTLALDEELGLYDIVKHLLPGGKETFNHHFYSIDYLDDKNCGFVWFGVIPGMPDDQIFIMDIFVDNFFRKKGIGKQSLILTHKIMKDLGYKFSVLNVLKDNKAKKLYESLGYKVIEEENKSVVMLKNL